jgi:Immune inhibitor A peptidase M6
MNDPVHPAVRLRPTVAALGLLALLVLALLALAGPALAATAPASIAYDGTIDFKNIDWPAQNHPIDAPVSTLAAGTALHDGRAPDLILTLYDNTPGHQGPYDVPFWKEFTGTHSDIYVGWDNLASAPTSVQQDQAITPAQIQYIGTQFDQRIWESDVFHFGNYLPRSPRADIDGERAAIFVHNIRDDAYWTSYRFYIAGYFSSGLNDDLELNGIFVDSYNWKDRLGVNTTQPSLSYLYEGTVAHEFQHLIHHDVDPNEADFINEGMAEIAMQFLYGSKVTASEIGEALFYHRDSLIDWKGELFDYGDSCLWQDYLWERAGGGDLDAPLAARVAPGFAEHKFAETDAKFADAGDRFVWNLIHDDKSGLDAVADWVGGRDEVERLFRDWTIANLLDGKVTQPGWNYSNLVLNGADSDNVTVNDGIAFYQSNVNGNMPPTRKNVRRQTAAEPWGAYYRTFGGSEPGFTMSFAGSDQDGIEPFTGTYEWYSGLGNMLQRTLERTITGVPAGGTLSFQTWFDIEPDWDYGYVEASSDGVSWTKLPQLTSLPAGAANLNGSTVWDGPGGLTGTSGGWQQAQYSLGGLSGTVHVRFRYATDEAFNGQGWYIDDITLGSLEDPVDTSDGWTTNGWLFTTGQQDNDWTVDAFVPFAKGGKKGYQVVSVVGLDGAGISGSRYIPAQFQKSFKVYGIVSNHPDGTFSSLGRLTIAKGK